jgi:YD repeat-containing protein
MFVLISCGKENNGIKEIEKRKIKKTTVTTHRVANFETDSVGYVVTMEEFDKHGNTTSYTRYADPSHIETQYAVDIKYSGDTAAVEKTYNYTVPAGKKEITAYVYGSNGKLERIKKVMGDGKIFGETFNYDEKGKLRGRYGNDGSFTEYTYDNLGKIVEEKISYSSDPYTRNRKAYYYNEDGSIKKLITKDYKREVYYSVLEYAYEKNLNKEIIETFMGRYMSKTTFTYNPDGDVASKFQIYAQGDGDYSVYQYEYY